jgi:hypothetical protein
LELLGAPAYWDIEGLPMNVEVSRGRAATTVDIIIAFFDDLSALAREAPVLARGIVPAGALWLAWPRRAGGHNSDITDSAIRNLVLPLGLVDVKVAALDDDWSGLKFVWRKRARPTQPFSCAPVDTEPSTRTGGPEEDQK